MSLDRKDLKEYHLKYQVDMFCSVADLLLRDRSCLTICGVQAEIVENAFPESY